LNARSNNPNSIYGFWLTFTWLCPSYKHIKTINQRYIILSFKYNKNININENQA